MSTEAVRVLVADDDATVQALFRDLLEARGDCVVDVASDGEEAWGKIASVRPDILITDLRMPRLSGEALSRKALEIDPGLTVLVETGNPTLDGAVELLRGGVFDFITKPFRIDCVERSVARAVDRSRRLRVEPQVETALEVLLRALGRKDSYLRHHGTRVGLLCTLLAQDIELSGAEVTQVGWMGLVHDVGKIGVPDKILLKPGPLTSDEYDEIRKHPVYSAEIVAPLAELKGWPRAVDAVLHHHERIDGRGYPHELAGDSIPFESKIIAVCDTYDALASRRPYQAAMDEGSIRSVLERAKGTQLDPELTDVFLKNLKRYRAHVETIR